MLSILTRPLFLTVILVAVLSIAIVQTQEFFFLRTGQPKIDFKAEIGEQDKNQKIAYFEGNTVPIPTVDENNIESANVLGDSTGEEKRIEVDLTNQRLFGFEGSRKVYDFAISSGRTITPTPTGEFTTWIKVRSTRMKGGSKALGTYYDLPNVPFVMFFANNDVPKWQGYGIHGAYWHNNFGHPMSHGCINMKTAEAKILYNWADPPLAGKSSIQVTETNPGTKVIIYGSTPRS